MVDRNPIRADNMVNGALIVQMIMGLIELQNSWPPKRTHNTVAACLAGWPSGAGVCTHGECRVSAKLPVTQFRETGPEPVINPALHR
jgi:hypothetical protein